MGSVRSTVGYLPALDRTYSALMQGLDDRGLLEEMLVVLVSDFGRTPTVNKDAGRDHWTYCYSVVFAGNGGRCVGQPGGVRQGQPGESR